LRMMKKSSAPTRTMSPPNSPLVLTWKTGDVNCTSCATEICEQSNKSMFHYTYKHCQIKITCETSMAWLHGHRRKLMEKDDDSFHFQFPTNNVSVAELEKLEKSVPASRTTSSSS
jgi:hypothetical protein